MSIISINKLELASKLSHNATRDELMDLYTEEELWKDDNGTDVYIEEAQEVFNRWYDYYEAIIDSCIVDDINDRIYNGEEPSVVLGSYGLNMNDFKKVGEFKEVLGGIKEKFSSYDTKELLKLIKMNIY